jgi:hypothetical protein
MRSGGMTKTSTILAALLLAGLLFTPAYADHKCNPSDNHSECGGDGHEDPDDPSSPPLPEPPVDPEDDFKGDNFGVYIFDVSLQHRKWNFAARAYTETSYWHVEAMREIRPRIKVGARYTDNDGNQEIRPKVIVRAFEKSGWYGEPRLEYRHNLDDTDKTTNFTHFADYTDREQFEPYLDHAKLSFRLGFKCDLPNYPITLWSWHEPGFAFAGDVDDFDFMGSRTEMGILKNFKRLDMGPFLRIDLDDNYSDPLVLAGWKVRL